MKERCRAMLTETRSKTEAGRKLQATNPFSFLKFASHLLLVKTDRVKQKLVWVVPGPTS